MSNPVTLQNFISEVLNHIKNKSEIENNEKHLLLHYPHSNDCLLVNGNCYLAISQIDNKDFITKFYYEFVKNDYNEGQILNCIDDIIRYVKQEYGLTYVSNFKSVERNVKSVQNEICYSKNLNIIEGKKNTCCMCNTTTDVYLNSISNKFFCVKCHLEQIEGLENDGSTSKNNIKCQGGCSFVGPKDKFQKVNNELYCEDCCEICSFYCYRCRNMMKLHHGKIRNEKFLCNDCSSSYEFCQTEKCGFMTLKKFLVTINDKLYCQTCSSKNIQCWNCDGYCNIKDGIFKNERLLCRICEKNY